MALSLTIGGQMGLIYTWRHVVNRRRHQPRRPVDLKGHGDGIVEVVHERPGRGVVCSPALCPVVVERQPWTYLLTILAVRRHRAGTARAG